LLRIKPIAEDTPDTENSERNPGKDAAIVYKHPIPAHPFLVIRRKPKPVVTIG
jgi:hypothetical protein